MIADQEAQATLPTQHEPGIYFGMPAEEYHADQSLSATGCKKLLVSPLDFWTASWMNPSRVEKESDALELGGAYHTLLLEGEEEFFRRYAVAPDRADFPKAIEGAKALAAECKASGLAISGTIPELTKRLREAGSHVEIWSEIMAEFEATLSGRTAISSTRWVELRKSQMILSRSESTAKAFTGGQPEVSLFWEDPETGVPMKCRLDFLHPGTIVDLKTLANSLESEFIAAVVKEIANRRYHVQAAVYMSGLDAIKALFKERGQEIVHLRGREVGADWITEALTQKRTRFHFLFQQTGAVPNAAIREWARHETYGDNGMTENAYFSAGLNGMRSAINRYQVALAQYGTDAPWLVDYGRKPFTDTDFPIWFLNAPEHHL